MRLALLVSGGLVLFGGLTTFLITSLSGAPPIDQVQGYAVLIVSFLVGALFLSAGFRLRKPHRPLPSPRAPT